MLTMASLRMQEVGECVEACFVRTIAIHVVVILRVVVLPIAVIVCVF